MKELLFIFIGGGCGSICRYLISKFCNEIMGNDFPYGTLLVNSIGSFLIGCIFGKFIDIEIPIWFKHFFWIGFLGGFTTFSSFSVETLQLIHTGKGLHALLNIITNFTFSLILVFIGFLLLKN
jgi:CrcB protein